MRTIHRYSDGVPRLINAVCDKTLLAGYVAGVDHLDRHADRPGHPRARGEAVVSLVSEALKKAEREAAAREAREKGLPQPLETPCQPYRARRGQRRSSGARFSRLQLSAPRRY